MSVAVITGASSGIGRATAEVFAAHGFHVAVLARRKGLLDALVGELKEKYPEGKFLAIACDLTKWEAVDKAIKVVDEQMGVPEAK